MASLGGTMPNGGLNSLGSPSPWWESAPRYTVENLESNAPPGYTYNRVNMQYERTPQAAGQNVYDYNNAASGGSLAAMNRLLYGAGGGGALGSAFGGSSGSSGSSGPGEPLTPIGGGSGGGSTPASIPHLTAPDMTASNAAIFSRAKDTAGSIARASLNSLNGELGASGMIGSGAQVQGTRDIVAGGAGMLADVDRQNAITSAQSAADFAKLGYTGDITQRGQDIQSQEAGAQLELARQQAAMTQSNAAQDRYLKMLQLLMSQFGGGGSSGGGGYTGF